MRDPKERLRDIFEAIAAIERYLPRGPGSLRAGRTPAGVVRSPLADHRRGGKGIA